MKTLIISKQIRMTTALLVFLSILTLLLPNGTSVPYVLATKSKNTDGIESSASLINTNSITNQATAMKHNRKTTTAAAKITNTTAVAKIRTTNTNTQQQRQQGKKKIIKPIRLYGMNYNPRQGADWDPNKCKTRQEIVKDLLLLSYVTDRVRLLSLIDCNQGELVLDVVSNEMTKYNMTVWLGLWVGPNSTIFDMELEQLENMIQLQLINPTIVTAITVGSEAVFRNDVSASTAVSYQQRTKKIVVKYKTTKNIPTGIVDIKDIFQIESNKNMISKTDFVAVNVFPFWESIPVKDSVDYIIKTKMPKFLKTVQQTYNKDVYYGETGWPSAGYSEYASKASSNDQLQFFIDFYCKCHIQYQYKYYWFNGIDTTWRIEQDGNPDTVEGHFGLFYDNNILKEHFQTAAFTCPNDNPDIEYRFMMDSNTSPTIEPKPTTMPTRRPRKSKNPIVPTKQPIIPTGTPTLIPPTIVPSKLVVILPTITPTIQDKVELTLPPVPITTKIIPTTIRPTITTTNQKPVLVVKTNNPSTSSKSANITMLPTASPSLKQVIPSLTPITSNPISTNQPISTIQPTTNRPIKVNTNKPTVVKVMKTTKPTIPPMMNIFNRKTKNPTRIPIITTSIPTTTIRPSTIRPTVTLVPTISNQPSSVPTLVPITPPPPQLPYDGSCAASTTCYILDIQMVDGQCCPLSNGTFMFCCDATIINQYNILNNITNMPSNIPSQQPSSNPTSSLVFSNNRDSRNATKTNNTTSSSSSATAIGSIINTQWIMVMSITLSIATIGFVL